MTARILVVEDDRIFQKFLVKTLEAEGYQVNAADDVEGARDHLKRFLPNLVLSDVKLGRIDGREFCRELKTTSRTMAVPVILISGSFTDQADQAEGLEDGADDYLLKPVSSRLLMARIQSVLRRYQMPQEQLETLNALGLVVNVRARTVVLKGHSINLTRKEFDLLAAFLKQSGQVLTPNVLLGTVWGLDPSQEIDTDTIKVHVSSLRKKLGPRLGKTIVNVPGVGYRFEV